MFILWENLQEKKKLIEYEEVVQCNKKTKDQTKKSHITYISANYNETVLSNKILHCNLTYTTLEVCI